MSSPRGAQSVSRLRKKPVTRVKKRDLESVSTHSDSTGPGDGSRGGVSISGPTYTFRSDGPIYEGADIRYNFTRPVRDRVEVGVASLAVER